MKPILTIVLIVAVALAHGQSSPLSQEEREAIENVLHPLGLTEEDLGFEKKWATDSFFRLKIVEILLDNPLEAPDYAARLTQLLEQLHGNLPAECCLMAEAIDVEMTPKDTVELRARIEGTEASVEAELPVPLARALSRILGSFEIAEIHWEKAFADLSKEEIERLLVEAPVLWGDEDDSTDNRLRGELHREREVDVDTSFVLETDTILQMAKSVDMRALVLSGISVLLGVQLATGELSAIDSSLAENVKTQVFESRWGRIGIGSIEDDEWTGDFSIILELGGNDRYSGRVGGAVGVLGPPFSVLFDMSGDDFYSSHKLFNFGSAVLGCGVLRDASGNDVYRGFHHSEGTGLFGIGFLWDGAGDDVYTSGYFAQGAGNFGFGGLIDCGGHDLYRSHSLAQGMGSVFGYGLLCDLGGHDIYYAGGRYGHHPLLPDDHRSSAQGFGTGWRPDASGGVGVLYDRDGNDFYCGQVYAQGSSYWYSLGMLVDGAGNDYYNGAEYAQGAGIHLSVGILVDDGGDDHYFCRYGPGQGEGHDLSSGSLLDRSGDDCYMISGGQGIGLSNSFGLLLDAEGDDHYSSTEAGMGQGGANSARGFGGIGIFLDLEGDDEYPRTTGGGDGSFWTSGSWGAGMDLPVEVAEDDEELLEPDTLLESVEEIFEEASLWEVGENRKKVRWARERLIDLGMDAVEYICREKLATKSGLELRAIRELGEAMVDSVTPCLVEHLEDPIDRTRANVIWLLGKIDASGAVPFLLEALDREGNKPRWVLSALGDIGDRASLPEIYPYLKSKDEPSRIQAAVALGKIKDPDSVPHLIEAIGDEFFTVRSAAENSLVSIADSSIGPILDDLAGADSRTAIHMIHALGRIAEGLDSLQYGTERVGIKKALVPFLDNEDSALRGYAAEALGRLGGQVVLGLLRTRMADELDPFVLGKYRSVLDSSPDELKGQ